MATTKTAALDKFTKARHELRSCLIERDDEIDLALAALVAGEHLLLVGPPGTAKSMLLDGLVRWMGGSSFHVLLTKFTMPEEIFGPVAMSELMNNRYVRVTTGMLPEAEFAFVDEVFKASSAILNTMLGILNERTYKRGDGTTMACPLRMAVGASNEWPGGDDGAKELTALFDRFIVRKTVHPVRSRLGRQRLRFGGPHAVSLTDTLTPDELREAQGQAATLAWDKAAEAAFDDIVNELMEQGIHPGDRRQVKAVGIVRAAAWLAGHANVEVGDLDILQHVLWDDPSQIDKASHVVQKVANPVGMVVSESLVEADEILAGVNMKDLMSVAAASKKLQDVAQRLKGVAGGNGKAKAAQTHVEERITALKMAAVGAM